MNKFVSVLGIGAVVSMAAGCASIVSDSQYPVAIKSTPDGASFEVTKMNGEIIQTGTTPQTVSLKSGEGYFGSAKYTIRFKKEGFEEQTIVLDSSFDGWYVGNIIFGGLIGALIVDPITGAMWKLPEGSEVALPESVANTAVDETEILEPVEPVEGAETPEAEQQAEDTISLITIDQVPVRLLPHLVRIN